MSSRRFAVYNVGSNNPRPVTALVDALAQAAHMPAAIRTQLLPENAPDVVATCANVHSAAVHLGWRPAWNLTAGVTAFRDWLQEHDGLQYVRHSGS